MTAVDRAELKRDSRAPLPPEILADAIGRINTDEVFEVGERLIHGDNLIAMAVGHLRSHAALLSEIEGLKAERDGWIRWADEKICEAQAETLAALRTQAPDSWRPDREAVARVIDPFAWRKIDRARKNYTEQVTDEQRREWSKDAPSLTKADAILALRPQTAESGK